MGLPSLLVPGLIAPAVDVFVLPGITALVSGTASWLEPVVMPGVSAALVVTEVGLSSLVATTMAAPVVGVPVLPRTVALVPGTTLWLMTVSKMGYGPGPNNSS